MSQNPLDYERVESNSGASRQFRRGLIWGSAVPLSLCGMGAIFKNDGLFLIALLVVGVVFLAALVMLAARSTRMVGLGMLAAVFVGGLGMFGICALGMR